MRASRRQWMQGVAFAATAIVPVLRQPASARPPWSGASLGSLVPDSFGQWQISREDAEIVMPEGYDAQVSSQYDAQLAHVYRGADGTQMLLVLACAAEQSGNLVIHRPESCYPAAGFTISGARDEQVPLARELTIPARYMTAQCDARVEQVLYWIRIGKTFPTSPWAEQWTAARSALQGVAADGVLVRMSCVTADPASALSQLERFASELYAAASPQGRLLLTGVA